jgi:MFS family permease
VSTRSTVAEPAAGSPPRGWRSWCAYAVMISPNAAVGLTLAAMPPILPELALHLGGQRSAQLITSVSGFGMIVGGMFSGRLLERVGIRTFTLASLLMYGLFGLMGLFLSTPLTMGASRFALGVGGVFFSTAAVALTAATFSGPARSRVIGLQQATSQIVNVCAVFIVGGLVQLTGWRGAFLVYGAFGLALFIAALAGIRTGGSVVVADQHQSEAPAGFLIGFTPVCALTTLMGILTVIPMAQLPFVLADNGDGAPRLVSLVLGANFILAAVSAMSYVRLKTRFGKQITFIVGLAVGMCGIASMGIVTGLFASCIAASLAGFGTGIYNTYVFDHGVEIAPPGYHGRAAGLLFAFMFFGAAINPFVAGAFEQVFGLHRSMIVMAAVAFACGLPVIVYRKFRGKPTPASFSRAP